MEYTYAQVRESAQFLRQVWSARPSVAMILGTGLGKVAESISLEQRVSFGEVPHFGEATVEGHEGRILMGTLAGHQVVAMQGRFHFYEGRSLRNATLPVRVLGELGAEFLFINSAAGGLNPDFTPGDIMVVEDHLNFIPDSPLRGLTDDRLGTRFPDMSAPYDSRLRSLALQAAHEQGIWMRTGIYAAVAGPNLETRAETRMLRLLGADAVGMSTVPEVIVATQLEFRTLVIAAITNVNIPEAMEPISLDRVLHNAALAEPKLVSVTRRTLEFLRKGAE